MTSAEELKRCLKSMFRLSRKIRSVFAQGDKNSLDDDRGFGKVYKWRNLELGFGEAKETGKPIFLVIHRSSCPACQSLKNKFSKSMQLIDLSSQFIMVNVEGGSDLLSADQKFQPDGSYVPRILFYTPGGQLISEAYNRQSKNLKYRYFHSSPSEIVEIMRFVLEGFGPSAKT